MLDSNPINLNIINGFIFCTLFPLVAVIILFIIPIWKIFVKAGEPGWGCIIPIYNIFVQLKIVKKPMYWFILLLIPIVNIVFAVILTHRLSVAFGKDTAFTVGLIFLSFIFIPILGYGHAEYQPELIENK